MSDMTPVAPEAAPAVPSPVPAADAAPPVQGAEVENTPDKSGETSEPEKPRQKASERIGELYGRMKAAERERDMAVAEVQRLRQPAVSQQDYDRMSFEEQQALQVRQAVRQERADEMAQAARLREYEANIVRQEMFSQRLNEARESIPDIDKVISDPTLPVSEIGARFIAESDKGPQVAYWLAQNRAEAARIASLDPYKQAFELGRLEQRASAAPAARKVSQAPAPVPIVGGGRAAGAKDPGSMSHEEMTSFLKSKGVLR